MGGCTVCGGASDRAFTISTSEGRFFTFDTFECAIDHLAPRCAHCGIRIIGHGTRIRGSIYCSTHCGQYLGIDRML